MKRKLLLGLVPLLGCTSIIGTGFALFQFNENAAPAVFELPASNVNLEGYASIGQIEIKHKECAKLVLDSEVDDLGDGIHLVYDCSGCEGSTPTQDQIDYSFTVTQSPGVDSSNVKVTTNVAIAESLNSYLSVCAVTNDSSNNSGTCNSNSSSSSFTLTDTFSISNSNNSLSEGSTQDTTKNLSTKFTFKWAENMMPDSKEDWETLSCILSCLQSNSTPALTVTYSVDFTNGLSGSSTAP